MELSKTNKKIVESAKKLIKKNPDLKMIWEHGELLGLNHGAHPNGKPLKKNELNFGSISLPFLLMAIRGPNFSKIYKNPKKEIAQIERLMLKPAQVDIVYNAGFISAFQKGLKIREKNKLAELKREKKWRSQNNYGTSSCSYTRSESEIHPDLQIINKLLMDKDSLDQENRTGKYAPRGIRD